MFERNRCMMKFNLGCLSLVWYSVCVSIILLIQTTRFFFASYLLVFSICWEFACLWRGTHKPLSQPYVIALYPSNLLIQVEDRGEGAVETVGGATVTEAPHPGATSNRNHPERSRGPPPSQSGNSTTCPNREEVRAWLHSVKWCL